MRATRPTLLAVVSLASLIYAQTLSLPTVSAEESAYQGHCYYGGADRGSQPLLTMFHACVQLSTSNTFLKRSVTNKAGAVSTLPSLNT
jgi:hypothetical protein